MHRADGHRPTRLSVIIPCHNIETYVGPMLQSLRLNAGPGIEFLLVNDASTDATKSIIERQLDRIPGASLINCPDNIGLSAARNVGIDQAGEAEYLTFLDGDDFVRPGYYPELLAAIEQRRCDFLRTDHVRVVGKKRTVHRINHPHRGTVVKPRDAILPVDRTTSVDAPNAWAGIFHRRLADNGLLRFNENLKTCEDRPWNWRLHLRGESFAVVGLLGVFYRRDVATSLTKISDRRQFDFLTAFDQIISDVTSDPDAESLLPKAIRSYCSMICHHLGRLDTYLPELGAELHARSVAALHRLPRRHLTDVVSGLDPRRQAMITEVLAA
ncbi:glycosyltransferase family 2 protein [Microlunatus speluncae]|uniref:glycosyltransferase family 2 protein n=1 Tax=Microlunatus speluncae TaxID=2594267 RepID=UPI001266415B|nr:glycosyltransferase family 2 protein [Microlunatus speluncae]